MEADLSRIKVALAVMSNAELDALIKATYKVEADRARFISVAGLSVRLAIAAAQRLPLRASAARGCDLTRAGRHQH